MLDFVKFLSESLVRGMLCVYVERLLAMDMSLYEFFPEREMLTSFKENNYAYASDQSWDWVCAMSSKVPMSVIQWTHDERSKFDR